MDESMFTHDSKCIGVPRSMWEEEMYTAPEMLSDDERNDPDYFDELKSDRNAYSSEEEYFNGLSDTPIDEKNDEVDEEVSSVPIHTERRVKAKQRIIR
jgi:hypothetical protein